MGRILLQFLTKSYSKKENLHSCSKKFQKMLEIILAIVVMMLTSSMLRQSSSLDLVFKWTRFVPKVQ